MKRSHILYGKKLLPLLILLLLVLSLLNALSLNMVGVSAGEYPAIYIDPATTMDTTLTPGKNYTISIKTDYNGSDIWSWKFNLTYNPNVLHGGVRKTDTWTSFPNNTDMWTSPQNKPQNKTKGQRVFFSTLKPVVPDSEEVYMNFTDMWAGDGENATFTTTGKPIIEDSEKVYVNQTLMTKLANYTIDYETGKITFTTAPGLGAEIKATYEALMIRNVDYTIDYETGKITFTTAPELEQDVTAIYKHLVFSTTRKPVPDSEEVYVNQILMTRITKRTEIWFGDGKTRIFYTTRPVFPGRETVRVDGMPPSWWGLDYTVDNSTGKITFDPAPEMGAEIKVTYDNWGNYTVDYLKSTITFDFDSQPPDGAEIKATYLCGGITNGDLLTKEDDPTAMFKPGTFNNTIGELSLTGAFFYDFTEPFANATGPGTLANVTFTVVSKGDSNITLGPATALSAEDHDIPVHLQHGYFDNRFPHDVAVGSVTAPAKAAIGKPMSISVEVANIGKSDEVANVTISYDTTYIDSQNVTLLMGESETVSFSWNTTGVEEGKYTINATATIIPKNKTDTWNGNGVNTTFATTGKPVVPDSERVYVNQTLMIKPANYTIDYETGNITFATAPGVGAEINATYLYPVDGDLADNWNTTTILLVEHDVAIISLDAPAEATVGDPVFINVNVTNIGAYDENVALKVIYMFGVKRLEIGNTTITLAKGANTTRSFSWNTTSLAKGNYTIKATATIIPKNKTDTWNGNGVNTTFATTDFPVVPDSERVYVNQTLMTKPANYTIDYETGNITFATAPGVGAEINATYLYPGDVDPTDNSKTTKITLTCHDIKVISVTASPYKVFVGELVNILVNVKNFGDYNETFKVKVSYDTNIITEFLQIKLLPENSTILSYNWNTTDVAPGLYNIKAEAILAEGVEDAKPDDNLKLSISVFVDPAIGTIVGTVTDASTGLPIEGANVTAGDYTSTTDAEGHYNITDIPAGTYTVTASKDGYKSSSQTDIIVVAGNTTQVDFELTPVQPPNILYLLYAGVATTAIIIAAIAIYFLKVRKPKPT